MKLQKQIQAQKKDTLPPQMRGLLLHATVRANSKFDPPSNGSVPTRFGHDFTRVTVRPSVPIIDQRYSNASCPMSPQRCPFGGACHTCNPLNRAKIKIQESDDKDVQKPKADGILFCGSDEKSGLSPTGLQDKPNLIPMGLHVGRGDLGSPCIECEDEEELKTGPLPDGGLVDPLEEEERLELGSWIVGSKETSMTNHKSLSDDDLLRSWVVGGAATPGTNTIVCDGRGGIAVQAQGTGNAAQTACLRDCIIQHEQSHRADALAANANICRGATAGNIVTVNTAAERKATEVRASNVEINCLRAKPDTRACRTIIANRIRQMIAYRDSF